MIDELDKNTERDARAVEEAWVVFKRAVTKLEGWVREIAKEEGDIKYEHINKKIKSERGIAEKIERKTIAWKHVKECRDEEYRKVLRRIYNNCKNVLNKARKKLRIKHKREVIREIECLAMEYPGEFWRLLKQVAGRKKKKKYSKGDSGGCKG